MYQQMLDAIDFLFKLIVNLFQGGFIMYKKYASLSVKAKIVFCLVILFLTMLSVVLSGCKEAQEPG